MVTKLKSFKNRLKKNKSFRKTGEIEIGEGFYLPLKSLSAIEKNKKIDIRVKPPVKKRKMTKEEQEEYAKENPSISPAMISQYLVVYSDETDEEYLKEKEEKETLYLLAEYCKYIDLKVKVGSCELWEDLGLENENDYYGLAETLFNKLELGEDFFKLLTIKIKALEGEPLFNKLSQLETVYKGKNVFELMDIISEYTDMKQKEVDGKEDGENGNK